MLSKLLIAINKVASDKGLSTPYIVGGLTRDKLLNRLDQINDVDITTGDQGIHFLAGEIAERLKGHPGFSYEIKTSGYSQITLGDYKLDFSSNFKVPAIDSMLREIGIDNPTEMQKELYSRDFTCNAALMTLDFSKIIDPTGVSVSDIKEKVIRTLLPPKLTLGYDNNRIVRVIYLAAKLGFEVDSSIKDWILKHPELIANSRPDYISKKLKKAAEFNPEIAGNLLTELGLWKYVPLIPELIEYQKEGLVRSAAKKKKKSTKKSKDKKRIDLDTRPYPNPWFTNYDYGGPEDGSEVGPGRGLYNGKMDKYKSTKDFIDKSRKRKYRRKALAILCDDIRKKANNELEQKIQELGAKNERPFNEWFGGQDRVYIPFDMGDDPYENQSVNEYRDDVIRALKENYPDKCQEIDFIGGYCSKGNNKYRVGKLLHSARDKQVKELDRKIKEIKNSETYSEFDSEYIGLTNEHRDVSAYWLDIINAFINSPIRAPKTKEVKNISHYVVISQNPKDIAYMSTYRAWESCMTLPLGGSSAGKHHKDVFCEVKNGGLIAYLIEADDKEIKDPLSRIRIRRFENETGESYALPEEAIYGENIEGFANVVKSWISGHQSSKLRPGKYTLQGGEWSDTFSNSLVVAPDDEKSLSAWISAPESQEGAVVPYWVVTDHLKTEESDLFEEDGELSNLNGDSEIEMIFYGREDAYEYKNIYGRHSINNHIYEELQRMCEREYRDYQESEGMSSDEIEENIYNGEDQKQCRFSEYLDQEYERFRITEGEDNHTDVMRRAVADKLLDSTGIYSKNLVGLVKEYLFDSDKITDTTIKNRFIEQYGDEYPDVVESLMNQKSTKNLKMMASFYKTLKEGGQKENLKNVLVSEIISAFEEPIERDVQKHLWLQDHLGLLQAFKPVPADVAAKTVEFANKVQNSDLSGKDKLLLINSIIHQFSMTNTDVPAVQAFYESRLPKLEIIPTLAKDRFREGVDPGHSFSDLGGAIARLGENGRQFIPFFKQKIEEVRNWVPPVGEYSENGKLLQSPPASYEVYMAEALKQPFGNKDPEYIKNLFETVTKRSKERLREFKLKTIEKLSYIIDALENGTGRSSRFNFHD